MDWTDTKEAYLQKMQELDNLVRIAKTLSKRVELDDKSILHQKVLKEQAPLIEKQVQKLLDPQFHVAVIGLEKAGKSALLNAWLGIDILPSKPERCTYTSTEIWSATSDEDQEYVIEYFTHEEFREEERHVRETAESLPEGNIERRNLEKDLDEIEQYRNELENYLGHVDERVKFFEIGEVREQLKQAVSENKAQARASKRVTLRTTVLHRGGDIVFHDVPGFDSPVALHQRLVRDRLSECDAIVYCKDVNTPSIRGTEEEMLTWADKEDPLIKISGKAFIALTRIDSVLNEDEFNKLVDTARQDIWTGIPQDRIVPVCSPAHLYRKGAAGPAIRASGDKLMERLQSINADDGIDRLKEAVGNYLDYDRSNVLAKRCNLMIEKMLQSAKSIYRDLSFRYPDSLEKVDENREMALNREFVNWWKNEWRKIEDDFVTFYNSEIEPTENHGGEMKRLKEEYETLVVNNLKNLSAASSDEVERQYKLAAGPGIERPQSANEQIRNNLQIEAKELVEQMSHQLAFTLKQVVEKMTNWMVNRLWGIESVRDSLAIQPQTLQDRLQHGTSTLFLRFARPAVEIFLLTPRGAEDRRNAINKYLRDLKILEEYYSGSNGHYGNLMSYLAQGLSGASENYSDEPYDSVSQEGAHRPSPGLGFTPASGMAFGNQDIDIPEPPYNDGIDKLGGRKRKRHIPGPGSQTESSDYESDTKEQPLPISHRQQGQARDLPTLLAEITEDVDAFADYLNNSVFEAAGFLAYFSQELQRIGERFRQLENAHNEWQILVQAAHRRGQITNAPRFDESYEARRRIAHDLNELRKALDKFGKLGE